MKFLLGLPFIFAAIVPYPRLTTLAFVKPLPEFTNNAFKARLQIISAKGEYVYATENYDYSLKKRSIEVDGKDPHKVIVDYSESIVTYVKFESGYPSDCRIISLQEMSDLQKAGIPMNFFGSWMQEKSLKMIPPKLVFSLSANQTIDYQGNTTIDGIPTDYWTTTMTWKNSRFEVRYYFTQSPWAPAASTTKTKYYPIRIETKGQENTVAGLIVLDRIYEYLDFVDSARLQSSAFDIPEGASCSPRGKVTTSGMPDIPNTISYFREIVDAKGNVNVANVIYDRNIGVMRIWGPQNDILYDFNTGIRYETKDHKCERRAIDTDLDPNSEEVERFVKDAGPPEFKSLNSTFQYTGQGHSRLIGIYSYGAIKPSFFRSDEINFGKRTWNFKSKDQQPPISISRAGKHYNIFNYQKNSYGLRHYGHPAHCHMSEQLYTITFVTNSNFASNFLLSDANLDLYRDAIAKQAQVNSFRMSILPHFSPYDHDEMAVTLGISISAPPNPKDMYRSRKHKTLEVNSLSSHVIKLPPGDYNDMIEKSASNCESYTSPFKCRNFDLCKNADNSFTVRLYPALKSGIYLTEKKSCDHFSKSVDQDSQISIQDAVSNLKKSIKTGHLAVRVAPGLEINAVKISDFFDPITQDSSRTELKFNIIPTGVLVKTEKIKARNMDDCEQQCLNRGTDCKAFKSCPGSSECLLSSEDPHTISSRNRGGCYIYKRRYLADFNSMPGSTLQFESSNAYKNVKDPNSCAEKCVNEKDFNCESFNYCQDSKQCLLSKTHVYSVTADRLIKGRATCNHFSKSYLQDFKRASNTALSSENKINLETISASTPEQCAYLCRTGYSGKGCVQFDLCPATKLCHIVTMKTKSYVSHVPSLKCDTFTLIDMKKAMTAAESGSKSPTYSNASFGGLAFAMVLIGMTIGAGIMYLFYRKRVLNRLIG